MSIMIRRGKDRVAKATPTISYIKEEPKVVEKSMSREEVASMPYFKLKSVAAKNDIETHGKKADDLREELIDKLNL